MSAFVPVIIAGGVGSRLWPLSRELYPKQLIALLGEQTMLQATVMRMDGLADCRNPLFVAGDEHRFMAAEQLRRIDVTPHAILLEPEGKNTAPAVAAAALTACKDGDDPVLLVLPADHVISDVPAFHKAVGIALEQAENGSLVTFGIRPGHAETGYGYIRQGEPLPGSDVSKVAEFVEKPDQETATRYVESGEYLWNSGMFAFKASVFLAELEAHEPDILAATKKALEGAVTDTDFTRLDPEAFAECPSKSIDYAVMEKTDKAAVVPVSMGWSDLGSWDALWSASEPDENGNVLVGDVLVEDVTGSYIRSESRLVTAVGLKNQVIIETPDGILVTPRDRAQDVKRVVRLLKAAGRPEVTIHRTAYRPWGSYTVMEVEDRYQVKHITVKPGASLSLQMHHHRAEHWIVVAGTAKVTRGDKTFLLPENESTFIPIGTKHRLENPGQVMLEMVEVQSGGYLGEDDIVRFDDVYGRDETG